MARLPDFSRSAGFFERLGVGGRSDVFYLYAARAARGAASFHLLVPNPAVHAEITDAERHRRHEEGEQ